MLLLQEPSTAHQIADWLVPVGILAVTIIGQLITSRNSSNRVNKATGEFIGATKERFKAVEDRVEKIETEQTQQWQSIGRNSNEVAELRGKLSKAATVR